MFKIAKENLNRLYAKIAESMGLFIPIKKGGEVNYHVWSEGKEVSLETLKTVKSTSTPLSHNYRIASWKLYRAVTTLCTANLAPRVTQAPWQAS